MKSLLIVLTAVAAISAAPALACGDPMPTNLRATDAVKTGLARAYGAVHPGARATAPLPGHTFYASWGMEEYAVATFEAQPSVITRQPGGRWQLVRDTKGPVCDRVVPREILTQTWWFDAYSSGCFTEPRR